MNPARAYVKLSEIAPAARRPDAPSPISPLSERAARQLTLARQLADDQRYTEASFELERALRYDPNHPAILRALATLNWEAGNVQRARVDATRALEANPDDVASYYVIGRCEAATGTSKLAIAAFRTALLCSNLAEHYDLAVLCHYHLAEALAKEGYLEAALQQYTDYEAAAARLDHAAVSGELARLLQADQGSAAQAKSTILERLGRYSQAAQALAVKAADSPHDGGLGVRYARLLAKADRLEDALDAVRAIRADDDAVIRLLREIHELAGHPEGVVDDLRVRLSRRPDEARLVHALSEALMRLGRPEESRQVLLQYLRLHPEADDVRAELVEVLFALSAWSEALQVSAEALHRHPDDPGGLETKIASLGSNGDARASLLEKSTDPDESYVSSYLRGVLATRAGRLDQAERLLRGSIAKREEFLPARAALARVYLRRHRYREALQAAGREEEDVAEDARLERVLGDIHERLDELDEAELHFRAAIQLDRADTESMLALAGLHTRRGHRLQAVRQLRALLQERPLDEPARELLAVVYLRDGKPDAAVEQFEKLSKLATTLTTKARCQAVLEHFKTRDAEAYRRTLLDAMEQSRPDAETWVAIAESYDRFDEATDVRLAYQHALAIDPEHEAATLGLVEAQRRLLAFDEAVDRLEALLPRRPNRHAWRFELMDLYWTVENYDAALALAEKHEAGGDLSEATRRRYRIAIVGTLRLARRPEEAIRRLQAWADAEPDDPRWSIRLAEQYLRQGQASRAVPIYEAVYRSTPEVLYELVDALVEAGLHDRANQLTLGRLHEDPDSDNAVMRLAYILAVGGRVGDAIELLRNKLLHSLNRQDLQTLLIRHFRNANRHEEAIQFTEALIDEVISVAHLIRDQAPRRHADRFTDEEIARRPDEPFSVSELHDRLFALRLELTRSLLTAEEYHRAEQQLNSWINDTREPEERAEYLNRLADCYQRRGDDARSNATLERVLAIVPDDVGLNNNVAYTWIDRGVRIEEAERMIRYALSRTPRQPAYLDTYGWLLYKKGSLAEAKKWLGRARRGMSEADPVVLDHLGDTCWRLGQTEEAIGHWTAAVKAVNERTEQQLASDARRVRESTQDKVDAARMKGIPAVEPLAAPETESDAAADQTGS